MRLKLSFLSAVALAMAASPSFAGGAVETRDDDVIAVTDSGAPAVMAVGSEIHLPNLKKVTTSGESSTALMALRGGSIVTAGPKVETTGPASFAVNAAGGEITFTDRAEVHTSGFLGMGVWAMNGGGISFQKGVSVTTEAELGGGVAARGGSIEVEGPFSVLTKGPAAMAIHAAQGGSVSVSGPADVTVESEYSTAVDAFSGSITLDRVTRLNGNVRCETSADMTDSPGRVNLTFAPGSRWEGGALVCDRLIDPDGDGKPTDIPDTVSQLNVTLAGTWRPKDVQIYDYNHDTGEYDLIGSPYGSRVSTLALRGGTVDLTGESGRTVTAQRLEGNGKFLMAADLQAGTSSQIIVTQAASGRFALDVTDKSRAATYKPTALVTGVQSRSFVLDAFHGRRSMYQDDLVFGSELGLPEGMYLVRRDGLNGNPPRRLYEGLEETAAGLASGLWLDDPLIGEPGADASVWRGRGTVESDDGLVCHDFDEDGWNTFWGKEAAGNAAWGLALSGVKRDFDSVSSRSFAAGLWGSVHLGGVKLSAAVSRERIKTSGGQLEGAMIRRGWAGKLQVEKAFQISGFEITPWASVTSRRVGSAQGRLDGDALSVDATTVWRGETGVRAARSWANGTGSLWLAVGRNFQGDETLSWVGSRLSESYEGNYWRAGGSVKVNLSPWSRLELWGQRWGGDGAARRWNAGLQVKFLF